MDQREDDDESVVSVKEATECYVVSLLLPSFSCVLPSPAIDQRRLPANFLASRHLPTIPSLSSNLISLTDLTISHKNDAGRLSVYANRWDFDHQEEKQMNHAIEFRRLDADLRKARAQ